MEKNIATISCIPCITILLLITRKLIALLLRYFSLYLELKSQKMRLTFGNSDFQKYLAIEKHYEHMNMFPNLIYEITLNVNFVNNDY